MDNPNLFQVSNGDGDKICYNTSVVLLWQLQKEVRYGRIGQMVQDLSSPLHPEYSKLQHW
jgi:hypothetical protein